LKRDPYRDVVDRFLFTVARGTSAMEV
jgi:hypothetical protein